MNKQKRILSVRKIKRRMKDLYFACYQQQCKAPYLFNAKDMDPENVLRQSYSSFSLLLCSTYVSVVYLTYDVS